MFIDSNRIKETLQNVTIRQGEGEKGRANEFRRNELMRECNNSKGLDGDRII